MKILNNLLVVITLICLSTELVGAAEDHDCDQCRGTLGTSIHGSTGKWLDQNVPHRNWACLEVEDLGSASQQCQMCEREIVRYVHRMTHDDHDDLDVGCICAGHMEGDQAAAKLRDRELKSRTQRRDGWLGLGWKTSKSGNPYLKTRANKSDINPHIVTITKGRYGQFSASIDRTFLNTWYPSMDQAKLGLNAA